MTCGCAEDACLAILRTTRASTRTDLRGPDTLRGNQLDGPEVQGSSGRTYKAMIVDFEGEAGVRSGSGRGIGWR